MTGTLTQEQAKAVADRLGEPLRLKDPHTGTTYVLVPADTYERMRRLLADYFHPQDAYRAIDEAFAPGWNDPKMADYDRYEELTR